MRTIKWRWDYNVYMCFCPYCDEPAYEKDKCVFCGKPYKWVEPKHNETVVQVGEYKVVQATNNHISIYGKDGEWLYHAQCRKKLTEEELAKQVDFWKAMVKRSKDLKGGGDNEA